MNTYRIEWDCCGSVTETQAWEPQSCPFCTDAPLKVAAATMLEALKAIVCINAEDDAKFRKRGGTRRGLSIVVAEAAIRAAKGEA